MQSQAQKKDRNSMDLTEAEDIKKRWQEYTEELFKKDLHDQDNHNCVITHLEAPDLASITVTSTAGYCFCFGFIPSFFLELFLH